MLIKFVFGDGVIMNLTFDPIRPLLDQISGTEAMGKDPVFLYDGQCISSTDTCNSLEMEEGDLVDVVFKSSTPSPEMYEHLLREGFNVSKFSFYSC